MREAPLGGFILYSAVGTAAPSLAEFHYAYLLSGISGMMALLLSFGLFRNGKSVEAGTGRAGTFKRFVSGIKEVGSDKRIVITSAMEGLQNMAVGALEAFLPIYAVTAAGLNEFQAGILWGVPVVTTILSKPIMGRISDRYGRTVLISIGLLICALSFGAIPLFTDFSMLMIAAAFFGLGGAVSTSSGVRWPLICATRGTSAPPWAPSTRSSTSATPQAPSWQDS